MLSTYVQSDLQGSEDGPCLQGACTLVNKINMHKRYRLGCAKGHPSKTATITRWLVAAGQFQAQRIVDGIIFKSDF